MREGRNTQAAGTLETHDTSAELLQDRQRHVYLTSFKRLIQLKYEPHKQQNTWNEPLLMGDLSGMRSDKQGKPVFLIYYENTTTIMKK